MLRLHLPPNLASAAPRDAIAIRVDLDLTANPAPELFPALALLQRWCGAASPPKFLQLDRAKLRQLIEALRGQPVFFLVNGAATPIAWQDDGLAGVSVFLRPSAPARPVPRAAEPEAPRRVASGGPAPLNVDGSEHFLALTLPSRDHPRYADALALVKENGFTLESSNRKWWLRDRHKALNFLATHGTRLRTGFDADFTASFEKNTAHVRAAEIAAEVTETGDSFAVTLGLRAGNADEASVRSAVATNRGYLETGGKVFLFDKAKLEKLTAAQRALAGDPTAGLAPRRTHRVSAARAAEAQEILEELSPGFQSPESWKTRSAALRTLTALTLAPIPETFHAQLRPYQRLGAAWLWHLHRHQLGGILADEMGLGKTLQALALLCAVGTDRRAVRSEPARPAVAPNPSLVVAPASLLENWRREAARFAPQLRVFVHHADRRLATAADFTPYDLVVTSYGTLARDQALFTAVEFATVIADEAQHIKNRRSQNAAALRALRAHARFLLTGTPLENALDDLRSLFECLLPGYLTKVPTGLRGDERRWFDERLKAQTAPYILRRTKKAVAPELPEKLEHVIWCEMRAVQARLYRDTQEKSERELFDLAAGGASEGKLQFAALTQLLRLRQICCDPRLVPEFGISNLESQIAFNDSAKLDAFNELLAEAIDDGHRVLVFSQFTSLLALLRSELDAQSIAYCYLDGSMPAGARQAEVDRFQATPEVPLFLLSLKAGGTGLNLTGADTVVHFDPWWNPAAEAQATDRAHRIGQQRVVTSYKLIAAGTVEEKVLALQAEKRALLAGVFEASDAVAAKLSLADLKALLKA
ncbi:MAG: DEAD/DEAH box helicase [Opitutus sp.]|nr:DEAD/DEAH box helicase [Opitutus sp.]